MPVQMSYEPNDVCVMRIGGVLKRSEFAAEQENLAHKIDSGSKPRILVVDDNFQGWEKGADWNDLEFMLSHGTEVAKIAIVADPRWEAGALAFAGAGFRNAPVKFFQTNQLADARSWLLE